MKKITKVLFLLVGLLGVTFISTAQAVQPYQHVTYGDVNAAFQNWAGSSLILDWKTGNLHAAPVEGKYGHIWFYGDYCVDDAHLMSMQTWFDSEDHAEAQELYQYQKDGMTALKRLFLDHPSFRDPGEEATLWGKYGWWFNTGHLFKPGEIPVGTHVLRLVIWAIDPDGNPDVFIDWEAGFNIHECWH